MYVNKSAFNQNILLKAISHLIKNGGRYIKSDLLMFQRFANICEQFFLLFYLYLNVTLILACLYKCYSIQDTGHNRYTHYTRCILHEEHGVHTPYQIVTPRNQRLTGYPLPDTF